MLLRPFTESARCLGVTADCWALLHPITQRAFKELKKSNLYYIIHLSQLRLSEHPITTIGFFTKIAFTIGVTVTLNSQFYNPEVFASFVIYELCSQIQVRLATQHFGRSLIKYAYGHYHIRLPKNPLVKVLHCIEQGLIKPNKEMLASIFQKSICCVRYWRYLQKKSCCLISYGAGDRNRTCNPLITRLWLELNQQSSEVPIDSSVVWFRYIT